MTNNFLNSLRTHLTTTIPQRTLSSTLLLATFNIREFDSPAYGARLPEALDYLAEIISRFDLVAIQEVRRSLDALDAVRERLGPWWKYVCTDVTEGRPGNSERMAFLFDGRKLRFAGISGEVVIPPVKRRGAGGKVVYEPARQLYRTPHVCGFKSGRSRFLICTVHVAYGAGRADDPKRAEEIRLVAEQLAARARKRDAWSRTLVLLGDFNIFSPQDGTLESLLSAGFEVPEPLRSLPSNAGKNRFYDQIALLKHPGAELIPTGRAGVLDYYQSVFRNEDQQRFVGAMGEAYEKTSRGTPRTDRGKTLYFRTYWRTHQMSDHLPMWMEVEVVGGGP